MWAGVHTRWDATADVVVVGFGGAGGVAAIAARDAGADVLILEKQAADGHLTSTAMSGGIIMCPSDIGAAAKYMKALCRVNGSVAWTDDAVIDSWALRMSENKEWVERVLGSSMVPFGNAAWAKFPGWESMTTFHYRGWGVGLMNALRKRVQARRVNVIYQARAGKLLTDSEGHIVGLRAEVGSHGESKEMSIRASKGVILTCGGFEYDEALKLQYLKMYPYYSHGTYANTGDGVRMAMDVGADLWHMNCCSGRLMAQFPDFPIAFSIDFGGKGSTARDAGHEGSFPQGKMQVGYIIVDKHGRSYASGKGRPHQQAYELALFDSYRLEHPRLPSYYIFDQARIDDGPLPYLHAGASGPCGAYKWSRDNSVEIERGWIVSAERVPELARKIQIDPDALAATLKAHNQSCAGGPENKPTDLFPLNNPPYYAVQLWPGGFTHGGARRNGNAQILNVDGLPMRGLYGAGEFGSVNGMVDASSGSLVGECIAFGRLAGENAAAEKR